MEKNKVLDIIIEFIKAAKNEKDEYKKIIYNSGEKTYKIHGAGYLLGQILRQYDIPIENQYISQAAEDKWNELSNDDIWKYVYRDIIVCTAKERVYVNQYIGNQKKPTENHYILKGQKFIFRDIFHDEHIIPIKIIIKELLKLNELSYENVESVLNKICICRILKEEDRNLTKTARRYFDFDRTYNETYKEKHIILKKR